MTSPLLQSVTASSTFKGSPRRHFTECRTSGGKTRQTRSQATLPQRTQKCSSAPSRKSGPAMPRTAPLLSADSSTLLKEKSGINVRWREHFSTLLNRPSTVDPTVLDQIPQKSVITSLDLSPTHDEASKAIRQTSSGSLQRSSSQPVQLPSKHSTHSSPASGKKRMCPKNSGMPHSCPCSRTGALRLTTATTGASLSCPSLGRS